MKAEKYNILILDLTNARVNEKIQMLGGFIYIKEATDAAVNIDVKIEFSHNDSINLKKQFGIIAQFNQFFITHDAQAGKFITLLITPDFNAFRIFEQVAATTVDISEDIIIRATTPEIFNIDCTIAATQYSQSLPVGTKKFTIKARGGQIKWCFTTGETGTKYLLLEDGQAWSEDNIIFALATTLYFQSPTAGADCEILAWS